MKRIIQLETYSTDIMYPQLEDLQQIDTIVYLFAGKAEKDAFAKFDHPNCLIVNVQGYDWNRDLSPWYGERVFAKGEDFAGQADSFLDQLVNHIVPNLEKTLGIAVKNRMIAGYSLGGLFTIYACTKTDLFDRAACMSGSLWFDGFIDYLERQPVSSKLSHAYFSLGKKEKLTKNSRMCKVESSTESTVHILKQRGIVCEFDLLSGGHFDDIPQRIANGIRKMLEM